MKSDGLGLVCALLRESREILTWKGWQCVESCPPLYLFHRTVGDKRVRLAVTGVGGRRSAEGLERLLNGFAPELVVSYGYGGGLAPTLRTGDLVFGRRVFLFGGGDQALERGMALESGLLERVAERISGIAVLPGSLVSVERPTAKDRIASGLDPGHRNAVVEMETYALARSLSAAEIPLAAVRAVLDERAMAVEPALMAWMDDELNVRRSRLLLDLARHPRRLALIGQLQSRSRIASRSLEAFVRLLVRIWSGAEPVG